MKIGFYSKYEIILEKKRNKKIHGITGENVLYNAYCKYLRRLPEVEKAELFAPNHLPDDKYDIMIYVNCTEPVKQWADKHIVYIQNGYYTKDKYDEMVQHIKNKKYDGHIFYSQKLKDIFSDAGTEGKLLHFAADTELFYPVEPVSKYMYDVAYVGNNFKGRERTIDYLYPATKYNFGLYGNWKEIYSAEYILEQLIRCNFSRVKKAIFPTKEKDYSQYLSKYAKGILMPENTKYLYSSSKIILNYGVKQNVELDNISLRTYEALACGAFLISDKCPSAEKEFEGKVVFSDGGKELEEQLEYYLNHPEERERIAQKGYDYVTKYANMEIRTKELYDYLQKILKKESLK